MSSITSTNKTELTSNQPELDNSNKITINSDNSELIIENNSTDVTITKFEGSAITAVPSTSHSAITMKTQVLPLVYIQTPTKLPFSSINKPNKNNMVVNNVSQFQFATLDTNSQNVPLTNVTVPQNQSVIFTPVNSFGKSQSLVLQKQPGNVVPFVPVSVSSGAKIGAYLTMLKPVSKPPDHIIANKLQKDGLTMISSGLIQQTNTQSKYVIAPMPNVTSNRLPATVTTNSVKSKIAFMPLPVSKPKKKFFNLRISEGKFDDSIKDDDSMEIKCDSPKNLICDEIITKRKDKSYELSITEDANDLNHLTTGCKDTTIKVTKLHKDPPKFVKHGVSILKKNYSERKLDKSNSILKTNPKLSISDSHAGLSILKTSKTEETIVIPGPTTTTNKPERRRKSNFAYRKDYDDMEIETTCDNKNNLNIFKNNVNEISKAVQEYIKTEPESPLEIEIIEEKPNNNNNNMLQQINCDPQKLLKWEEGIGTLPGSKIKFIINEFNLIEYVTPDEYHKIIDKKLTTKTTTGKEKSNNLKEEFQEEMRCLECGCYGLPSEFINPKYCSYDCQEAGANKFPRDKEINKFKKKRKRGFQKKTTIPVINNEQPQTNNDIVKHEKELSGGSDEEITSNDNSQDKYPSYPWSCKKKGFSWAKYLDHIKAKAAPVKLFKDPFPYSRNSFRPGMKLEGVDPQHPSYFCVLTVAEAIGYRIRLHFDGYPENYDFWVNADSMDIFPMGWCEKYGHVLQPPRGYTVQNFNWFQYLKVTKATAAPKHLFTNRSGNAICPNGFRVGMKLEAVDRKNTSLVCVATIRDMMDNRILVHFDSWDDIYDYWADPNSPYIHPIGWCDQYGHNLTPPNDYPSPETFTWEVYLRETKSQPAPVRAFKQKPTCGFKRGMRLECVDKRVPQLIRAATVDDVREHQIRIHFDGWPDRYSYWVDDDSLDIHPVGWCQKTGHPLEPPLTPEDVFDFLECATVGCRGLGHIRGPKYSTHSNTKQCPYAEDNIDAEKILPDRLLSPDRTLDAVVPVSREPKEKIKPRIGRPPKYPKPEPVKMDTNDDSNEKKPKRKYTKRIKLEQEESVEEKAISFVEKSKIMPAELESWERHSEFLKEHIHIDSDPRTWSSSDVTDFISTLPYCQKHSHLFDDEEIDGDALLSLNQEDILNLLHVKVGPAVKLYNVIVLMRQYVNQFYT